MAQPSQTHRPNLSMPIWLGDLLAPYLEAGHDWETARALVEADAALLELPEELAARW